MKKNNQANPFEMRKAIRRWDKLCLGMFIVLVLSILVSVNRPYDLSSDNVQGFSLWFLLCSAYPGLVVLSFVNFVLGPISANFFQSVMIGREAIFLGSVDLVTLLVLWAVTRFYLSRVISAGAIRVISNFLLILIGWGAFQLGMFTAVFLWRNGGLTNLHREFENTPPAAKEKVAVAAPASAAASAVPSGNGTAKTEK
ncbi:MAG: hypothetical protein PHS41_10255 [Victivallaceae bacterium]|nr:hypothetical protein [Victivallaceae bacterium]